MAGEKPATRRLELGIERLILGSRWLQAPLYLGLLVVLANTMSNDKLYVLMPCTSPSSCRR